MSDWADCGILSCPSPKNLLSPATTPKLTPRTPLSGNGKGGRRMSYHSPSPSPGSRSVKKGGAGINRGVGHSIKRPSVKKSKKKRARNPVEAMTRTQPDIEPPKPRLPQHRRLLQKEGSTPKRHQLSSPGMSLLDSPDSFSDNDKKEGKFFKSRSNNTATVNITKNIRLSANYGDISLERSPITPGQISNGSIQATSLPDDSTKTVKSLADITSHNHLNSVEDARKAKPSRYPSPRVKKTTPITPASPSTPTRGRARKSLGTANTSTLLSPPKSQESVNGSQNTKGLSTPNKRKLDYADSASPIRSSPRLLASTVSSPLGTPSKEATQNVLTPTKRMNLRLSPSPKRVSSPVTATDKEVSPRTSILTKNTPVKLAKRISPRKTNFSPSKIANRNVVIEMVYQSPKSKSSPHKENMESPHKSPRRSTPTKLSASPLRKSLSNSPLRAMNRNSPLRKKISDSEHTKSPAKESDLTFFPIFDPKRRLSHTKRTEIVNKRPRSLTSANDTAQMTLDAGQAHYGAQECRECGLIYDAADVDDAKLHEEQHKHTMKALSFGNWKSERTVSQVDSKGGRCVLVTSSDPPYCWRKVSEILSIVDSELGYACDPSTETRGLGSVVLYVVAGSVAGCLVAERAPKAYRVLSGGSAEMGVRKRTDGDQPELLCCSKEPVAIKYGINRIWVRSDHRRRGLASMMVDAFRRNMVAYHYLKIGEFAFSDPTMSGVAFARKYTKVDDFLVYRHNE